MSKYFEQEHRHKGRGKDGSPEISYNDLLDKPAGGGLTSVATDATLDGDGTVGDPLSVLKLATARTIELTGDVTGSASFDGSATASIAATVARPALLVMSNQTADQTLTTATLTKVNFTDGFDLRSEYASNKFTASTAGKYRFVHRGAFGTNATGYRYIRAYVNNNNAPGGRYYLDLRPAVNGNATTLELEALFSLAASDYVEFYAYQTSGGNLDLIGVWGSLTVELVG